MHSRRESFPGGSDAASMPHTECLQTPLPLTWLLNSLIFITPWCIGWLNRFSQIKIDSEFSAFSY